MPSRRLPGIQFEANPPALDEWLPRMDIAVFVGFASEGPVNQPIALESVAHFAQHFGPDLPLAWDAEQGDWRYAYLAPAVRSFFRNGGRRCWVINVGKPTSFDEVPFVDPALREVGVARLLAEAEVRIVNAAASGKPLTEQALFAGIHAALTIEEATLIAVPDAVQLGWFTTELPVPAAPVAQPPPLRPEWWHALACDAAPPTTAMQPPIGSFLNSDVRKLATPLLQISQPPADEGTFTLAWDGQAATGTQPASLTFSLQEATRPDFSDAVTIYSGGQQSLTLYGRSLGDYYYQVRSQQPASWGINRSDWSAGLVVRIAPPVRRQQLPSTQYNAVPLLIIQRALLRLCAARGDLCAVLNLPAHYRAAAATAHVQALVALVGSGEETILSYGALYHPWLLEQDEMLDPAPGRALMPGPPDGAICGLIARRSLQRGAWVAPANEPLRAVVALEPPILRSEWQAIQDAQINLVRQEPQGFLTLSSFTLSRDPDFSQLNVRRLLILLRRLALREGTRYVFEPNDDSFRRLVQRGFEAVLARLYALGAFAGKTASSAFQVVAGTTINTPRTVEQGRFVVELRIAPSQPLTFLIVRLVQSNERLAISET